MALWIGSRTHIFSNPTSTSSGKNNSTLPAVNDVNRQKALFSFSPSVQGSLNYLSLEGPSNRMQIYWKKIERSIPRFHVHWFFTYPLVYCESSSYLTCHIWPLKTSRSLTWEEKRKKIFSWDFGVWSLKMDANWKALEVEIFWVGFSVASWWMGKNVWSEEGFRDIKTPTWISNSGLKKTEGDIGVDEMQSAMP